MSGLPQWLWRAGAALGSLLFAVLFALPVFAQAELRVQLGASEIEVGEAVEVELTAMAASDQSPSAPELVVPAGFEVRGPQVGTRQQVSISGFKMVRRAGLTATWRVTASRPGLFSLGPVSVLVGGERKQAAPVQLKVVPAGQLASKRGRQRRNRMSPFSRSNPFDDLFDTARRGRGRRSRLPSAPSYLVLPRLPDKTAFLHAVISPRKVVVGQQITLSVYAYGARGIFQEAAGSREASYPDFLAQRLVEDPSEQPVYQFDAEGQSWIVVKVREVALFALRTGKLEIGATQFGFLGRRYSGQSSRGLIRKSKTFAVEVVEPPLASRPPGYSGDVGQFRVSATVEPREVTAGDSVSVQVHVKGSGRMPARLKLPEQSGVHWDEPTLRDRRRDVGTSVAGERTFQFIVRLADAGDVNLGDIQLPYFNPKTGRYTVAKASLGRVLVAQASRTQSAAVPTAGAKLLSANTDFRKYSSRAFSALATDGSGQLLSLADANWFWWLVLAGPLFTGLLMAGLKLWSKLSQSRAANNESLSSLARRALLQARAALTEQQLNVALQCMERAVYLGVQAATGVLGRGVLRRQLVSTLQDAGLEGALSQEVVRILDSFEAVRFSGEQTQGEVLLQQVEQLLSQLSAQVPPPGGKQSAGRGSIAGGSAAGLIVLVSLLLAGSELRAKEVSGEENTWSALAVQVQKGDFSSAIDQLELWSDQGKSGRDLSFNRGVAYLGRAESSARRPSDWGQAVAAFQEASLLDPDDLQAQTLAEAVRAHLSQEQAKLRGSRIEARPRLLRALVSLVGDNWWVSLSLVGSFLLTLGMWLRWLAASRVSPAFSMLVGVTGLGLLLGAGTMTGVSHHFRANFEPAVVIVSEARLLDAAGLPLSRRSGISVQKDTGDRISMGTLLYLSKSQGSLVRVQWGDREGFVRATTVRRLAH